MLLGARRRRRNIESSYASAPIAAKPCGLLRMCPRQRTAVALVVCTSLDSPTLPSRLRLPNMASFLLLIKWHASCFMTGVSPEKGYIN